MHVVMKKVKEIDWDLREKELKDIAKKAKEERKKRNGSYDCVIGVSGGKDSTFQAVYAKEKLASPAFSKLCSR